ncbi:MAG: translation initiation factor eIF-1A [Euryarchaeota archaeon]|nr:translation initiation factor eIF-1A [Euryarchaeota archaeon]
MARRREEKVDEEYLAQLMGGGGADKIRVKMPNRKVNEMFAIADKILGGRRVNVVCADGQTRLARIPGKMRRRQWVREGDLIIVWPWDFQDAKADVKHRYNKTQALYLSRKGMLPEIVDIFGLNQRDVFDDGDGLFAAPGSKPTGREEVAEEVDDDVDDDDVDDLFADGDDDDDEDGLFADAEPTGDTPTDASDASDTPDTPDTPSEDAANEEESSEPAELETPVQEEEFDDDDDDDEEDTDLANLFA